MERTTLEAHLITEGEDVPDAVACLCHRTLPPADLFDARDDDISGDWRCIICLSDIIRQEVVAAEITLAPPPSWSPDCEMRNGIYAERNIKLSACDWTQVGDAPLVPEAKAAWASYRQELRDLPATFGSPDVVVWPTPPV